MLTRRRRPGIIDTLEKSNVTGRHGAITRMHEGQECTEGSRSLIVCKSWILHNIDLLKGDVTAAWNAIQRKSSHSGRTPELGLALLKILGDLHG